MAAARVVYMEMSRDIEQYRYERYDVLTPTMQKPAKRQLDTWKSIDDHSHRIGRWVHAL
jgi:hypothetical protein